MMRILSKFGGSSLSSSTQFIKVKKIIESNEDRKIVVVSAPGKDDVNKTKVTDLLLLLHAHIEYEINHDQLLTSIYDRYKQIIVDLDIDSVFDQEFEVFKKYLKKGISKDYLISRGEYFNALILSEYLGYSFLDANKLIYVGYDGNVDYDKTKRRLEKNIEDHHSYVIPGFYASTPDKQIRVFNRGGSDLTGSIIARLLEVDLYENWTDVSGLFVADPKIIKNPKRIDKITYNELRELSYRGANIIQQESIIPLNNTDIPIQIKNTNIPNDEGTIISRDIKGNGERITGMSGQTDFTSLTIVKDSSKSFAVILSEVIGILNKYKLGIEHIPTGIDTFSIITKTNDLRKVHFDLINDIRNIDGIIDVSIEDEIALIAIVGRNMSYIPGVAGKIFSTLGKHEINIKVIAQASKEISIIIGVNNSDYENAISVLYQEFYE